MLRNGLCSNTVNYVYQNQNCRCNCNSLRQGIIQNEIPVRVIIEGLRNGIFGGGLPRDVIAAGIRADIGNGILGNRLSGNTNGINANTGIRSGMIRHGLPLDGSGDHFQATIGNAAGGKEYPFDDGTGVNVGIGTERVVSRKGLHLNGNNMDIGVGAMNGLVEGELPQIGLKGDFSTGIGQGIFERRVPVRRIGEVGTGMIGRRGVVRNDIAERLIDGGMRIGIENGLAQSGLRRNMMGSGIRSDMEGRLLGGNLPANSIGVHVERGIMNGLIGMGLPIDDIGGTSVRSGPGGVELTLSGGSVGVPIGNGLGNEIIINELPSNGIIGDENGIGISTAFDEGGLPLNTIGLDFKVGADEALRWLSTINFTSGISPGIVARGIHMVGNRDVETLIGSMEPGSGPFWNSFRGDIGEGLWSGVGSSGLPMNTLGLNTNTGLGHGLFGNEWSPNSMKANIGHGIERSVFGGLFPGRVEIEYGPRWMFPPIRYPTVFHTGNMFIGKKSGYWRRPYFPKYPRRFYPKYYPKHNHRRRFF